MRKYHRLTISDLQQETKDSVRLSLSVPEELRSEFEFLAGQHLPMQIVVDDKPVRRTYSICTAPGSLPLQVGIRVQPGGVFSEYVANQLSVGDEIDVMPPFGRFHADIEASKAKTHIAFAAGSGITPILSIIRTVLEREPQSQVLLFYGNRQQQTTMFIDDLFSLKNQYPERLQLSFLFSREEQEFEMFGGRIDADKVDELCDAFCANLSPDDVYICGPDTMIEAVRDTLVERGIERNCIHVERYGAPRKSASSQSASKAAASAAGAKINVILDGHRKSFRMPADAANIVDAAAEQGIDLPFSCKGGVCATCRTHVANGEVRMAANYGLEPWEVDNGFVLACQSTPVTDEITIDYDKT